MLHCHSHTLKLGCMIGLVLGYFLVEIIVGNIVNSITLIADSFHMLSDLVALLIGITARRVGKWPKSSKNTFGWQRAEVVGTLVNTVMLSTLSITILIESIKRFTKPENISHSELLLYVGIGGLVVNILGLIILRNHHGHSHGIETTELLNNENELTDEDATEKQIQTTVEGDTKSNALTHHGHSHHKKRGSHMNMQAVFLHVLADFFGSVSVVVSALIIRYVPNKIEGQVDPWKAYIDPSISFVMVILIFVSTFPLLRKSVFILLQSVPKDVSIKDLKEKMEEIEGIEKVHDLHVWLLQSDVIIGTVHIRCSKDKYVTASKRVKNLFHDFKIHCTTIQAEFDEHAADDSNSSNSEPDACVLYCETGDSKTKAIGPGNGTCQAKQDCCPTKQSSGKSTMHHQGSAPSVLVAESPRTPPLLPATCGTDSTDSHCIINMNAIGMT